MPLIPVFARLAKTAGILPDVSGQPSSASLVPRGATVDPRLRVEGLREFRRDLKKLDHQIDRDLRDDIRQAAGAVLIEARSNAPIRTGALARSLKVSVTARGASVYSTLPYAPVVHWGGTITPRGVPITFPRTEFISRAVERHADGLIEEIGDSVERAAKRAGWH